jgi:cyanate lyase
MTKFELEKQAMAGDREATLQVVSDLRRYRAVFKRLIDSRYGDGTVDGATMGMAMSDVEDIEGEAE